MAPLGRRTRLQAAQGLGAELYLKKTTPVFPSDGPQTDVWPNWFLLHNRSVFFFTLTLRLSDRLPTRLTHSHLCCGLKVLENIARSASQYSLFILFILWRCLSMGSFQICSTYFRLVVVCFYIVGVHFACSLSFLRFYRCCIHL